MYLPKHFQEDRVEVLGAFLRDHPLATLISLADHDLIATHLPMLWDPEPAPFGTLTGHFARPNPHGRGAQPGTMSLAVFLGAQAYVSPSWYPSKREHGKVVPTWSYIAVHAYGALEIIDDPVWLRALVSRLTDVHEAASPEPWHLTDAPEPFVTQTLKGILGVRLRVDRLEGKWKLGQNRSDADYEGTRRGLESRGDPPSAQLADAMATWRRQRSE